MDEPGTYKSVGGVVVISTREQLTGAEAERLIADVGRAFKGRRVLVVPPGWDVCELTVKDLRAKRDAIDRMLLELQGADEIPIPIDVVAQVREDWEARYTGAQPGAEDV